MRAIVEKHGLCIGDWFVIIGSLGDGQKINKTTFNSGLIFIVDEIVDDY